MIKASNTISNHQYTETIINNKSIMMVTIDNDNNDGIRVDGW